MQEITAAYESIGYHQGGTELKPVSDETTRPSAPPAQEEYGLKTWLGLGGFFAFAVVLKSTIGV